ncbi:MAG: RDD family protein [Cyclobacteriaceae bacterium]
MGKRIQFKSLKHSNLETQFWLRALAFVIDYQVVRILIIPFIVINQLLFFNGLSEELDYSISELMRNSLTMNSTIPFGLYLVLFVLYCSVMESSRLQGTIGKRFFRFKVFDKELKKITFNKALLRNATKIVSVLSIIGVFMIDMSKNRQGLHDLISRTVLIKR